MQNTNIRQNKLTKGVRYNTSAIRLIGWTDGDGTGHDGYNVSDYFAPDFSFRGADQHGIEPLFE